MNDMTQRVRALVELERRGELPDDLAPVLGQLRQRGIVEPKTSAPVQPLLGSESLGAAMVSAGSATESLLGGAKDIFYRLTGNEDAQKANEAQQVERRQLMGPLQDQFPVSSALGSALPYFSVPVGAVGGAAGRLASAVPKMGALGAKIGQSTMADAVLTGGLAGALDSDSTALSGMLGGGVGNLAGKVAARTISPLAQQAVSKTRGSLAQRARNLGFKLTPGQRTGSAGAERFEESMKSFAPTSGAFTRRTDHNQAVANSIAAKAIGETGEEINDEILGQAANRIGKEFKDVTTSSTVRLDDTFLDSLADVEARYTGAWGEGNKLTGVIDDALDDIAKGSISGERYHKIASRLGKMARQKLRGENSDPDAAFALYDVKEALDDAMERALGKAERARFQKARQQYRTLLFLESPGVVNSSSGQISLPTLANVLKRKDKVGFARGKNKSDLYEAARIGQMFKPSFGASGTAERLSLPILASGMTTGMVLGDPVTAAAVGVGLPVAARAGAEAYNAASPYMVNQLMTPARKRLVEGLLSRGGAGAGLLGSPVPQVQQ